MPDELVQLASIYADPGFLLLARDAADQPQGCVGLRALPGTVTNPEQQGDRPGEMRRLFVAPDARSGGLGRKLTHRLIDDATSKGFTSVVLNTLPSMTAAIDLYVGFGFTEIEPYVAEPLEGTLYFGLSIGSPSTTDAGLG